MTLRSNFLATASAVATALALSGAAAAQDPYAEPDDSWVSLTGEVIAVEPAAFALDYGQGVVTVEMDDWDTYPDGGGIMEGDDVRVTGKVDDDLFELTTVEADSVYVYDRNSYHFANPSDEEGGLAYLAVTMPTFGREGETLSIAGDVTAIDGRAFTLETSNGAELTVDTWGLPYNPLDDMGVHQVDVGDRVLVSGVLDLGFFDKREIEASSLTTMIEDAGADAS